MGDGRRAAGGGNGNNNDNGDGWCPTILSPERHAVYRTSMTGLRETLRRPMGGRNKLGAWLAILTCPCHVVMLGFVLTGTALGTWLIAVRAYVILVFSLLFLFGLWLMIRPDPSCRID
jgi:hypothetical protein